MQPGLQTDEMEEKWQRFQIGMKKREEEELQTFLKSIPDNIKPEVLQLNGLSPISNFHTEVAEFYENYINGHYVILPLCYEQAIEAKQKQILSLNSGIILCLNILNKLVNIDHPVKKIIEEQKEDLAEQIKECEETLAEWETSYKKITHTNKQTTVASPGSSKLGMFNGKEALLPPSHKRLTV